MALHLHIILTGGGNMNAPKTIAQQIQDVVDDMCTNYCKYPETRDEEAEGCDLSESEVCANCPLSRLV